MKLARFVVLAALITLSASKAEPDHRRIALLAATCDNDGHCTTPSANVGASAGHNKPRARLTAALAKTAHGSAAAPAATDANGNAAGVVVSHKTGARARVGAAYAGRFQAYIDDLENNHGARVLFMGGIRPGRCTPASQHPCGKALDVCQVSRGGVDRRCNLPDRITLGKIASAHGLFEGGRWCHSDYGHAQTSVTAAACGDGPFRIVGRATPETAAEHFPP